MQRKIFCITLALAFIFGISAVTMAAGMHNDSFSIPTSVFSSGGAPMESESGNFKTNSTIGPPSPLMDPTNPPHSENYYNYPSFWYTLEAVVSCSDLSSFAAAFGSISPDDNYNSRCDFDHDGDVDGSDLAEFASKL